MQNVIEIECPTELLTSGFSIGFSGAHIIDIAEKNKWYLAPCIYNPEKQLHLVDALVNAVVEENLELMKTDPLDSMLPGGKLMDYLLKYAPILKDSSFKEEREWRLISTPLHETTDNFDFREGNSMLIPFYKLPLYNSDGNFHIHELLIGPTPHPKLSRRSAKSFLSRHFHDQVPVSSSNVPYRSW